MLLRLAHGIGNGEGEKICGHSDVYAGIELGGIEFRKTCSPVAADVRRRNLNGCSRRGDEAESPLRSQSPPPHIAGCHTQAGNRSFAIYQTAANVRTPE